MIEPLPTQFKICKMQNEILLWLLITLDLLTEFAMSIKEIFMKDFSTKHIVLHLFTYKIMRKSSINR